MRGFEGFVRRAVVIVPPDEDYKARTANREIEEGKEVPESAVLDMKGTLALTLQVPHVSRLLRPFLLYAILFFKPVIFCKNAIFPKK